MYSDTTGRNALFDLYNGTWELADFPGELQKLSEAILCYNFTMQYLQGKSSTKADFFSHNPKWSKVNQPMVKNIWGVPNPVEPIVDSF